VQGTRQSSAPFLWWSTALAIALVAAAGWLRAARLEYLVAAWIATLASVPLAWRTRGRERKWRLAATLFSLVTSVLMTAAHGRVSAASRDWPAFESQLVRSAAARLDAQLTQAASDVSELANAALDAPTSQEGAFGYLHGRARGSGERAVVLYENDAPLARD
jgi:hypothetical protein